jgi:SHS2 domain-containing protein
MNTYRTFDHTADLGIEVYGQTREELFVHAAEALSDLLADREGSRAGRPVRICATGDDWPDLLVNFLREILYQFHGNRLLLKQIRITTLEENKICAEARGEVLDLAGGRLRREIKAVTYHQASLLRGRSGRWTARVILDV